MIAAPVSRQYAGIVSRAVAFIIDAAVINAAAIVLAACVTLVASALNIDVGVAGVLAGAGVWGLAGAAYFVVFWTLTGQTPGMRVLHICVTDEAGRRPRVGRSVVRVIGLWLAAIPLMAGYALILFDPRRQGLQDKLARTFVRTPVDAHPPASLSRPAASDETAGDLPIYPEERPA